MSLRVWLPLTKDLRNQGLDDVTVTNNGATFDTNGKLGGCYNFDGSHYLQSNKQIGEGWKEITFACWVYLNETVLTSGSWYRILGIGAHTRAHLDVTSNNTLRLFVSQTGTTSGLGVLSTTIGQAGKWYHLCGVLGNNYMSIYINGLKENEKVIDSSSITYTNADYFRVGSITFGNAFNGKISDVRVYDHALSSLEVKQISQGLILHYPLNRGGFGVDNILVNTHFDSRYTQSTGWDTEKNGTQLATSWGGYNGGVSNPSTVYHAHLKEFNGEWVYEYIKTASETWLGISQGGLNSKLTAGKTYTFSWEQYCVSGSNYVQTGLYYFKTGATSANFHLGLIYGNVNRELGKWQKFSRTFIAPEDGDYSKNMSWYIYGCYSGNGIIYVRHPKLEEGNTATPWSPSPLDTLATTMGLNNNVEYDCSGFGNNGTRIGTFTWTSDTPKYQVSTHAVGSSTTHLEGPPLPTEAKTVTLWIKGNKSTNGAIFNDKTSGLQIGLLNSLLYMNSLAATAGFTTSHWKDGQWNHVVAVNNNGTRSLYVNGQPETQSGANNYYIHNADNFWLWNRSYNNTYAWTGDLSDLRIYVTALSADDVKSLYQNSAYIDNQGNIYGAVYEEV